MMTKNTQSGFTILETLLALSILIVALTAAFSAAQSGLSSSMASRDQVLAFHFAQEGVEVIRNMRDENGLRDIHWLTGISNNVNDPCYFGNFCAVDSPAKTSVRCGNEHDDCSVLRQDTSQSSITYGMYGIANSSWMATPFKRSIVIEALNPSEIAITVRITWTRGTATRSFAVRENLLNWQ